MKPRAYLQHAAKEARSRLVGYWQQKPIFPPIAYELIAVIITAMIYNKHNSITVANAFIAACMLFVSVKLRVRILSIRVAESERLIAAYRRFFLALEANESVENPSLDRLKGAVRLNNLATLYLDLGEYKAAEGVLRKVESAWREGLGTNHPDLAGCLNNLAIACAAQGLYSDADSFYKEAMAILETYNERHSSFYKNILNNYETMLHEA